MLTDIQQQKKFKILLIGDSCLDVYVMGTCDRISPEAPVPVFLKNEKSIKSGMSKNVFQNLENISGNSVFHLTNDPSKIKKIRFIDNRSKQQVMRYDIENPVDPLQYSNLPEGPFEAVVISDYNKGFLDDRVIKKILEKYPCKIFVDSKRKDLSIFKGCLVKINEHEAESSYGTDDLDLIVTMGSQGAKFGKEIFPTTQVEVYDVCGAGDVFLSSLVTRWLEIGDIKSSIMTANYCASFSTTKLGTYQLTREEYEDLRV